MFYQLGAGRLFTLTDKHVVGEALAMCGAENVFGKLLLPAPEVSAEAVLAARPDAVLVAWRRRTVGSTNRLEGAAIVQCERRRGADRGSGRCPIASPYIGHF